MADIYHGVGKRKSAIARVWMKTGTGSISVNNKPLENYFPRETLRYLVYQPLRLTGTEGQFDVKINVKGGGISGQADAVRYGIAKALMDYNIDLRPTLKKAGLCTRDARVVERKKYGRRKARKGFQWRKR
jgi:small subunit ribosomal protein S9